MSSIEKINKSLLEINNIITGKKTTFSKIKESFNNSVLNFPMVRIFPIGGKIVSGEMIKPQKYGLLRDFL